MGDVASKPALVVSWIGLITGGVTGGAGVGLGSVPLEGPPGVGVGTGVGLGGGGAYLSLGRNHSWNGPLADPGARYAIPDPSGAQAGCATSWSVMTALRGPRLEPFHVASVSWEICFSYVQIIATSLPSGDIEGSMQSSSGEVSGRPSLPWGVGRVVSQIWPMRLPSGP